MATEVEKALNTVENIAQTIKKTYANVKKCPKSRLTQNYIQSRLKCVEEYWSEYKSAHGELVRNIAKDKSDQIPYFAKEEFYDHEELYIALKSELMDLLSLQVGVSGSMHGDTQQPRVVLPKIHIPTYSGQYEDWWSFHDLFNTLVHTNESLNNVQKIHYLKTALTGEAASILKHIQVTDSNYEEAWNILKRRYGNKRITVNAIMNRLFSQKKMATNNSTLIKKLLDTTFECLHFLKNMKVKTENWDILIIFIIVQKLDADTHKDWEEHVSTTCQDGDSLPSLEVFQKFLESRFRTLEVIEPSKFKINSGLREKSFHIATKLENKKKCLMCDESHTLSHCKEFGKYSPKQRSEFSKAENLCFNCLTSGHSVRQCRVPICCRLCKRRHHTLLHEDRDINRNNLTNNNQNNKSIQPEKAFHACEEKIKEEEVMTSHVVTKQNIALLATAVVQVRSEDNYTMFLRALIDQGSQASFITEKAAQQLKAKRYPMKGTVVGVGSAREDIKQVVQVNVESRCEDFSLKVKAYVMSKQLTTKIPSRTINITKWPHLEGLTLADPQYFKPGAIDLLLGVDVYAQIAQDNLIKGPPGSPCASKTNLGWILFGRIEDKFEQSNSVVALHHHVITEDCLKVLWEIDEDKKRKYTKDEKLCEDLYENNYTRDSKGKYVVRLPFNTNYPMSPDENSREIAMKRLIQQEK